MTLNAFMKSERQLHQQENPDVYANGYRMQKARGFGKELRSTHENQSLNEIMSKWF